MGYVNIPKGDIVMKIRGLLGMSALLAASVAQANLFDNGSFESGTFTPPGNATMTLNPGSTSLTGWQVVNDSIAWIGVGDPWGLDAVAGDRFLDLSDYTAGVPFGGVSQTIPTAAGTEYSVTFNLGSSTFWGRPSSLTVTAGSTAQTFTSATTGSNNDWNLHTFNFIATAASTPIAFVGNSGVNYIGLDDVAVSVVPEPSLAVLLLAGLGVIAVHRVRRERQALPRNAG